MAEPDPIIERLEDQIAWYDRKSLANQHTYKRMKVFEIVAAALIPLITPIPDWRVKWVVGALGVVITAFEGIIQLNQYSKNWVNFRSTNEALKHEKFLYLAGAGDYATATKPRALLAERVESIVLQENAKWITTTQQPPQSQQQERHA